MNFMVLWQKLDIKAISSRQHVISLILILGVEIQQLLCIRHLGEQAIRLMNLLCALMKIFENDKSFLQLAVFFHLSRIG